MLLKMGVLNARTWGQWVWGKGSGADVPFYGSVPASLFDGCHMVPKFERCHPL